MPTVERPHAPALIGAAANFAQSEGRPEHRSCSPAPEADQLGTRPFYAWKVGLGGGEMGAVVRPERNSGAIGSPTDFRSWMSCCESGTAINPGQRSEERRVGKEGVSKVRQRWAPYKKKKKKQT